MARAVVTALVYASQRLEQDPALARRYLGDWVDRFGDLLALDPGYPQRAVLARLDVLPTVDGPKVIEYNTTPGGILPGDQLSVLFQQLAGEIGFDRDWQIRPLLVLPAVRDAMIKTYQAWGGTGAPLLIFAVPRELKDFIGQVQITLNALATSGLSARIADPGELEFSDGRLRHQGDPVGILVRVFLPEMIPGLGDRLHGIFQAVRAGVVCMITAFRNTVMGHKALFALMTDPEIDLGLPTTVSDLVRTHVPWTRLRSNDRPPIPLASVSIYCPGLWLIANNWYASRCPVMAARGSYWAGRWRRRNGAKVSNRLCRAAVRCCNSE
jgi:hypothetical protein